MRLNLFGKDIEVKERDESDVRNGSHFVFETEKGKTYRVRLSDINDALGENFLERLLGGENET